jgi:addiction module HigA family antidote
MKAKTKRIPPAHPGEILLLEFLESAGISQNKLALATGLSVSRVNDLIKGRRGITPDTAIRLGAATGVGAEFWLNLQHDYDMRLARQEKGKEYATIKLLSELALTKAA